MATQANPTKWTTSKYNFDGFLKTQAEVNSEYLEYLEAKNEIRKARVDAVTPERRAELMARRDDRKR